MRFKIVGRGGVTLEQKLRRSNPWAGGNCGREKCFPCRSDGGGDCWKESVCYDLWCDECGKKVCSYKGETEMVSPGVVSTLIFWKLGMRKVTGLSHRIVQRFWE